jgi:hypothetical protein
VLTFTSCGYGHVSIPKDAMDKFEAFKKKEKFVADTAIYYPGIGDSSMLQLFTDKINLAADDFESLTKNGHATDEDYQNAIKNGLDRFAGIYIDSEDQDRICYYFEELMDIVGLESSGGHLNNFRYGFDPNSDDAKKNDL